MFLPHSYRPFHGNKYAIKFLVKYWIIIMRRLALFKKVIHCLIYGFKLKLKTLF